MNSIILKELLTNASRHKGEPIPAAIKIMVDYVERVEKLEDFYLNDNKRRKDAHDKQSKYIGELEARIDELEDKANLFMTKDKSENIAELRGCLPCGPDTLGGLHKRDKP